MKIAITVSQVTPGGGLTKYVCTLTDILTSDLQNEVWVITTHQSESNPTLEGLKENRKVSIISLGHLTTIRKYVSLTMLLRRISPDLLIVNYNAPTQYVLPLLPRKIKTVHILHNNTPDFYRVAAINGNRTTAWIAPTPALAHCFDEYTHHTYSERIATIPHGVEFPLGRCQKGNSPLQLSYVGVLYEHKGVKILPAVIKRLVSTGHKFHFTFIGDGILRGELEQALQKEMASDIVKFTGRISGHEVYECLSRSDVFVYPTHIDAFGLVIAEAMINGAVPIVTRLEGITDSLIDNEIDGFLVTQDDVDSFVERITRLMDNPTLRSQMSAAATYKANTKFSIDTMRKNYIDCIHKLV